MHDLNRIRRDLYESLSLDKHPVAVLLGAGCPVSVRISDGKGNSIPLIPDIKGLTSLIDRAMAKEERYQLLLNQFKEDDRSAYTLEDLLSQVRLLARIVGNGKARGLAKEDLQELETKLSQKIAEAVSPSLPESKTAYHQLADWAGAIQRQSPVHFFTTNYDLLLEQALEELSRPYFDGFVGGRQPFFDLRAIEDDAIPGRWSRLWKLHGSVNWRLMDNGDVIRTMEDLNAGQLLIHPSELKYDQSRRMPYLAMIDRLRDFLRKPSAFLITIGYSYADDHLNEILLQGFRANPTSAGFGLLYKNLDEETNAERLITKVPPNLTLVARDKGVVRGSTAQWTTPESQTDEKTVTTELGDFAYFGAFLSGLSSSPEGRNHA